MNLDKLNELLKSRGCKNVYVKSLSANDNSKNQVYFGGGFEILNILPINDIKTIEAGDWNKERFKASLRFSWITDEGLIYCAPNSQLILYPKYPEVRFSGFLLGCEKPPSFIMNQRKAGRLLFISVSAEGVVLGYVVSESSGIAKEFAHRSNLDEHGVFKSYELNRNANNKSLLLKQLRRIHSLGWIKSKKLDKNGEIVSCGASNCGGLTLEAELGITPNSFSEPDYMGWEIKQYGVKSFKKTYSKAITLMTPAPTDGLYRSKGAEYFIRTYGYEDKLGRPDRINFGGIHKVGELHKNTKLKLVLLGFDSVSGKIRNSNGKIALLDTKNKEAASWSFSSMLLHWNKKHNNACYVPSLTKNGTEKKYKFGNMIMLGRGADFQKFLAQMINGSIYYDPGIKLENASSNPRKKERHQFRIKSKFISALYRSNETIDLLN